MNKFESGDYKISEGPDGVEMYVPQFKSVEAGKRPDEGEKKAKLQHEAVQTAEKSRSKLNGIRKKIITLLLGASTLFGGGAADYMIRGDASPVNRLPGIHEKYLKKNPDVRDAENILKFYGVSSPEKYDHYHLSLKEAELVANAEAKIGDHEIIAALKSQSVMNDKERKQLVRHYEENIEGFDTFQESSRPEVKVLYKELVDKTIPKGIAYNISSLGFSSKEIKASGMGSYLAGKNEAAHVDYEKKEIIFSGGSEGLALPTEVHYLKHEMFHLNDWVGNNLLTRQEKLEMLEKVINRINAKDRYHSDYVEQIFDKNSQERSEEMRTKEYFAEIGAAYLEGVPLSREDAEIIHSLVQKTDPAFNASHAEKLQESLVARYSPPLE